jgi:hypothetical protein
MMTEYSPSGDTSRLLRTHEGMTSLGIDLADLGITNSSAIDPLRQTFPGWHASPFTPGQRATAFGSRKVSDPKKVIINHHNSSHRAKQVKRFQYHQTHSSLARPADSR